MTLREKVGQMFFIRPEALDPDIHWETYSDLMPLQLHEVNERMKALNQQYSVGVSFSMNGTS